VIFVKATVWRLALASLLLPSSTSAQEIETPAAGTTSEITSVRVHFVTNRQREEVEPPAVKFGGQRGTPSHGSCEVEFKPIPLINEVAPKVPFYVPSETSKMRITATDSGVFWDQLIADAGRSSTESVVVFVHGYSYDFERGCDRAAEVRRALQGKMAVVMFSWPSNGRATDYTPDLADLEWSVPLLADLLGQLSARLGPSNVHVLSHSMGARGVVLALNWLLIDQQQVPVIGHWVLLAPDLDSETFIEFLPRLAPAAESLTLYASSNDTPLKFSHQLSGSPRLGEAGEFLTVVEGMETVDVSPAGRYRILGHEYFLYHPKVGADLAALLTEGKGAAERSGLRSRSDNGLTYWEIIGKESQ
jgi:esterase/lipase superfamily enzyme